MPIAARDDIIQGLLNSTAPLTLLTGDSGVGKTTLLELAREAAAPNFVIPNPEQLASSPGSLQRSLLQSLAAAVALITKDQSGGKRLGEAVQRVVRNVADLELRDLADAVGRHLLGLVRAKIGDEAADALTRAGHALTTSNADALLARITNVTDVNILDLISAFAQEIRQLTGDKDLILTIDNVERLTDDDIRRLSDLASRLPQGVRVWGAFGVWNLSTRRSAGSLSSAGARELVLGGLSVAQVSAYLSESGVASGMASLIHRITQGYPLYVQDAVELIRSGATDATLEGLKPEEVLRARTRQAWRDLPLGAQKAAMLLAPFFTPLTPDAIADYLGMDQASWVVIEHALHDASIFTGEGQWWFHEMRRRCIWESVLSSQQRATAVDYAGTYLASKMEGVIPDADSLFQYLRLAPSSPLLLAASKVQLILDASSEQLAVAASVLDLIEPPSTRAIAAEACLLHARDAYRPTGDLELALRQLVDQGLLVIASNEHASVVAPAWGSIEAVRILEARALEAFGRLPLRGAATQLFQAALAPRLGAFRLGMYGAGSMTAVEMSHQATKLQRYPDAQGIVHVGRNQPSLLIRARHGGLPLSSVIVYDDAEQRDSAKEELQGLDQQVLGAHLQVDYLVTCPQPPIPALRFPHALERLLGQRITPTFKLDLPEALPAEEAAERRSLFVSEVTELCTATEKLIYGLDEPLGLLYHSDTDSSSYARVIGWSGVRRVSSLMPWHRPFLRFDLLREAGLPEGTRIGAISWHSGELRTDPIVDEAKQLYDRVRGFNAAQDRDRVPLTRAALAPLLTVAADRRWADMQTLYDVVSRGREIPAPVGRTFLVLVQPHPPNTGPVLPGMAIAMALSAPNDLGRDEIALHFVEELPTYDAEAKKLRLGDWQDQYFPNVTIRKWRNGAAVSLLADFLDHETSDVGFLADVGDLPAG